MVNIMQTDSGINKWAVYEKFWAFEPFEVTNSLPLFIFPFRKITIMDTIYNSWLLVGKFRVKGNFNLPKMENTRNFDYLILA